MIFSLAEQRKAAEENSRLAPAFVEALRQSELSFICEVKKASPSKGVIAEGISLSGYCSRVRTGWAAAISCLTEPYWFQGKGPVSEGNHQSSGDSGAEKGLHRGRVHDL